MLLGESPQDDNVDAVDARRELRARRQPLRPAAVPLPELVVAIRVRRVDALVLTYFRPCVIRTVSLAKTGLFNGTICGIKRKIVNRG